MVSNMTDGTKTVKREPSSFKTISPSGDQESTTAVLQVQWGPGLVTLDEPAV